MMTTLTRHRDIQNWVCAHHGVPAVCRVHNNMGEFRARLALSFATRKRGLAAGQAMPSQDDGISPVSWTAWLAELDRQHLALKILDQQSNTFELVERRELN